MPHTAPIKSIKGLAQYVEPKKNHEYVITVDVSRGVQSDYSAFVVFDATKMPYNVVAKYRNNEIKPFFLAQETYLHNPEPSSSKTSSHSLFSVIIKLI